MSEIYRFIKAENLRSKMVLTVYDSLVFSVPPEEVGLFAANTKLIMETWDLPWVTVPIRADVEFGRNWGNMVKLKDDDLLSLLDGTSPDELFQSKITAAK